MSDFVETLDLPSELRKNGFIPFAVGLPPRPDGVRTGLSNHELLYKRKSGAQCASNSTQTNLHKEIPP